MSRAFVKDDSDAPEPRFERRPASTLPNYVTPRGLTLLRADLSRAVAAGDNEAAEYFQDRIDSAIVIDPAGPPQGRGGIRSERARPRPGRPGAAGPDRRGR